MLDLTAIPSVLGGLASAIPAIAASVVAAAPAVPAEIALPAADAVSLGHQMLLIIEAMAALGGEPVP